MFSSASNGAIVEWSTGGGSSWSADTLLDPRADISIKLKTAIIVAVPTTKKCLNGLAKRPRLLVVFQIVVPVLIILIPPKFANVIQRQRC
jgi:hypothetical protein